MRNDFLNNHWLGAVNSPQNLIKAHCVNLLFNNRLCLGFEGIFIDNQRAMDNDSTAAYLLFNINLSLTNPIYDFEAYSDLYDVLNQHPRMIGDFEHTQVHLKWIVTQ